MPVIHQVTTESRRRGLLFDGTVSLSQPTGGHIVIRGAGERIEVDIDRSILSISLLSNLPPRAKRRHWIRTSQPALSTAKARIDLLVDGHPVGRYDGRTKGTLLAHLLGLGPVDLSLRSLLRALVRGSSKPLEK
jgi:hypothetical protein